MKLLFTRCGASGLPVLDRRGAHSAVEVQIVLAERGQHRAASIPDLLIAATTELAQLTVLHVDRAFELIADDRSTH